ncbi:MAG: hypothetical protein HW421_645 [Ignavibacteria bacterium]|nr:hypothetical protein [Ignavibacteria bacterium]
MFIKMRKLSLITLLLLFFITKSYSYGNSIFQSGEELTYEVTFLGFKLGTIRMFILAEEKFGLNIAYRAMSQMESIPQIPYFKLNATYQSWIDQSAAFSYKFEGSTRFITPEWDWQRLIFDYQKNFVVNEKWKNQQKTWLDTVRSSKKWNDGCSLFYFARQFAGSKRGIAVPTVMERDTCKTIINFTNKVENVNISSIDYPVRTLYFNGAAKWTGVYGITGNFEAWVSDDNARIPIKAKMKVYVGSVNIELVSWKRDGWTPPR